MPQRPQAPQAPDLGSPSISPLEINPLALSLLQQRGPQPPTAAPPSPTGGLADNPEVARAVAQQIAFGTRQAPTQLERSRELGDEIHGLSEREAALPLPKTGWLDTQGKPAPGGFLHNLERALEAIAGGTTIGQAIQEAQYGPGIRRYQAESGALAKKISELQKQQELEQAPISPLMSGPARTLTSEASLQRAGAAVMRAETAQIAEQHMTAHREAMERIASGNLTEKQKGTQLRLAYIDNQARHQKALESLIARGQSLGWDEATLRSQTDQLDAQFNRQAAEITAHPLWATLFGTQSLPALPTPTAPAISPTGPGAGNAPPAKPKAKASAQVPAGATHIGTSTKDGKDHYLDAQGRDLGPVK